MAEKADKELPKMVSTNMTLVLNEAAIKWAKTWTKPYKELTEFEQRTFITSFNNLVGDEVTKAVNLIVGDKRVTVQAQVDQVVFKDGCKIVLKAAATKSAFDLAEVTGHKVLVIVTGAEKYQSEEPPKPEKDQAKLKLDPKKDEGAGVKKDSRTKRSGKGKGDTGATKH